jgi:carboxyl-terminal processing protease
VVETGHVLFLRGKILIKVKWIGLGCLCLIVTMGVFVAGMAFEGRVYAVFSPTPTTVEVAKSPRPIIMPNGPVPAEFSTFWEAWNILNQEFYGQIPNDDARVFGAIRGMVNTLGDQHTLFIDPVHAALNRENQDGVFEGVGATLKMDDQGQLVVADSYPNRPAYRAGLRQGDVIVAIDGQPTQGLSVYEAVTLIRGPMDTIVIITITRAGQPMPRDLQVVRAKIEIELIQSKLLVNHIGYLKLAQFSEGATEKLNHEMQQLISQGATKFILDLRSNPGGLLTEAVSVGTLFMNGVVVIERLKNGEEKQFPDRASSYTATSLPLVILVNGGSASASEIVAGAVQDSQRGAIIGEQSFGKGSVQSPHQLQDGSELRVTVAEWLTPLHRQIHKKGITPDIVVKLTNEDVAQGRDPQIDKAVEYLK